MADIEVTLPEEGADNQNPNNNNNPNPEVQDPNAAPPASEGEKVNTEGAEGNEGGTEGGEVDETAFKAEVESQSQAINDAKETLTKNGLDYGALETEYLSNGAISAESYEALEKAGYSKQIVDAFIAGIEATNDKFVSAIYGFAGGEAEYQRVVQHIQNKGKADVDAYDTLIEQGNLNALRMVIAGAKAEITKRNGTANPSIMGGGNGVPVGGYNTADELTAAMSDSRYGVDEAYTKQVGDKMLKSGFIKFNQ